MMQGQLTDPKSILSFILAGNATVTFRSAKTGTHYTYKIRKADKTGLPGGVALSAAAPDSWFVKLLIGADNQSSYTYIGMIRNGKFGPTRASKLDANSVPVKTFTWVIDNLQRGMIPPALEVWHEGRCGKCGRKLTVPESIATGFGPDCAANIVDLPLIKTSVTPIIDQLREPKQQQLPLEPTVTPKAITGEQELDNVPEL